MDFSLVKMLTYDTAKMWPWLFIVQKAKTRYDWDFNLFKMLK